VVRKNKEKPEEKDFFFWLLSLNLLILEKSAYLYTGGERKWQMHITIILI
jgi:hypothetical protein